MFFVHVAGVRNGNHLGYEDCHLCCRYSLHHHGSHHSLHLWFMVTITTQFNSFKLSFKYILFFTFTYPIPCYLQVHVLRLGLLHPVPSVADGGSLQAPL